MKSYPYLLFSFSFLSVALGALNSVVAPAYLPDILADLKKNTGLIVEESAGAWINFAFLAGASVGGILMGFASDLIGRKKTLILSLFICGAGSVLGALCTTWLQIASTRFVVGIGVGTALVASTVMLSEYWVPRTKAVALGILSVAYPVGIIASGIITSLVHEWRTALFIGILPAILVFPAIILLKETFVPETTSNVTEKISLSTYRSPLISGILIYGTMLVGLWSAFAWLPTWVETLSGNSVLDSQTQRGLALTLFGIGGLIGGISSGWFANRFGARMIQAVCFILCLMLSFLLFKLTKTFGLWVLIGSGVLGLCFGISQGVLNILIPTMFPVKIRSAATGLCFHIGRVFTAIAVFFTGIWALSLGGYGNAIFNFSLIYIPGFFALVIRKYATY